MEPEAPLPRNSHKASGRPRSAVDHGREAGTRPSLGGTTSGQAVFYCWTDHSTETSSGCENLTTMPGAAGPW